LVGSFAFQSTGKRTGRSRQFMRSTRNAIQKIDACEYLTSDDTYSYEEFILELRDTNTGEIKKVEIKRM